MDKDMSAETNTTEAAKDPDRIADWLRDCLERKANGSLHPVNTNSIERFTRQTQTRVLESFLASIVSGTDKDNDP